MGDGIVRMGRKAVAVSVGADLSTYRPLAPDLAVYVVSLRQG